VVIGWTGSHSTLKYLEAIEPILMELEQKYHQLELLVIADLKPQLGLKNLRFIPWSVDSEITSLLESDIGIMPLPDDEWAKGKCGFKALQYMALEIPTAVSPVGVNTSIVDHGVNGFICSSPQEWVESISALIEGKSLREQLGKRGRQKVIDQFSVDSNRDNFLSLFS
jgi:glycosyltransferase involved in cell wall biosynthesis